MPKYRVVYSVTVDAVDEDAARVQAHTDYADNCGHVEVDEVDELGNSLPAGDGDKTCLRCGEDIDPDILCFLDDNDARRHFCSDDCQHTWHETH